MKQGRIIQSTGSWYKVWVEPGGDTEILDARLPGKFRLNNHQRTNPGAAGDRVRLRMNEDGTATIDDILERENALLRQTNRSNQDAQIIASNINLAIAVQAARQPRPKPGFIDRFLVTCEAYEITPLIVINKMDLARKKDKEKLDRIRRIYSTLGYELLFTSIEDSKSVESLKDHLKKVTSVMVGHSGVGKTSLLNEIEPGLERRVGAVSTSTEKGKHTTTYAQLIPLHHLGGWLIDTPGIREFGLLNIEPDELWLFFFFFIIIGNDCNFHYCTHIHEPGCPVKEALEEGKIFPERFESYIQILESLEKQS